MSLGDDLFRYLAAIAIALCAVRAEAQDVPAFRLIEVDGSNVRWTSGSARAPTVTYAFANRKLDFPDAQNCRGMVPIDQMIERSGISRAAFRLETRKAFATWQGLMNIQFRETRIENAGIVIGAQSSPEGRAFTDVANRYDHKSISRSLICLNPDRTWKIGFDGNLAVYDLRYTLMHEIGHAIGLDHPDSSNQLMSFRYNENFRDLQPGDRLGAILLYGQRAARAPPRSQALQKGMGTNFREQGRISRALD